MGSSSLWVLLYFFPRKVGVLAPAKIRNSQVSNTGGDACLCLFWTWCNLDFMTAMAGSQSVTLRRWPRKVSNCTTRPHVRGDQARRNQRGKQNRNLCSAAALKTENFRSQQEKATCVSVQTATARTFVSKKRWSTSANWLLGLCKKHKKVSSPTLFLNFSEL